MQLTEKMTEGFQITKSYVARGEGKEEKGLEPYQASVAPDQNKDRAGGFWREIYPPPPPPFLPVYFNPPRGDKETTPISRDGVLYYGEGLGELGEPGATPGSDMPRLSGRACVACVRYGAKGREDASQ